MSSKGVIGVQGLKTTGNELAFPPGTVTRADNCTMPAPGVIQPCRGFLSTTYIDNDPTDAASHRPRELFQWGNHLFISMKGSAYALALWENWASSPSYHALGALAPPEPETLRMKFAQLAQSAYFTTSAGLYGIDRPANAARAAGMQRCADFWVNDFSVSTALTGNPNATGSWFPKDNAVAGRAVVGRKDSNGVVKLSEPCGRFVVINPPDLVIPNGDVALVSNVVTVGTNADGTNGFRVGDSVAADSTDGSIGTGPYTLASVSGNAITYPKTAANHVSTAPVTYSSGFKSIQWTVPLNDDAEAGWFVQIYRTDETGSAAIDPGDECFLAYERTITADDISNGYVIITDTTPSSFLGEALPTNVNTGDGPDAGANVTPPLLRDVCTWDSKLFGIQTVDHHRLAFRLLGCGSPSGLQSGDVLAINTQAYRFGSGIVSVVDWRLPSQNIVDTCQGLVHNLWLLQPGCSARFIYDGTSPTGEIEVDEVALGAGGFAENGSGAIDGIYAATSRPSAWADPLATTKAVTVASTSRTSNVVTMHVVAHGFTLGQQVMLAYANDIGVDANFPPGLKTVTVVVDANNFKYAETGANAVMTGAYYAYATTFKSDDGVECVRFTKAGEPDAWPQPFTLGGLPDGASPLRIRPTSSQNGLLIFLKNGDTYRVSGQYPYFVRKYDGTAPLIAADSLVEHNSQLHGLTTQGTAAFGDAGVGVTGRDIEDDLRELVYFASTGGASLAEVFGVSYESDHQYHLWVPDESGEAFAESAFIFNSMDAAWAGKLRGNRTCGLIFRGLDQLVMGVGDTNRLVLERKVYGDSLNRSFAGDRVTLTANGTQSNVSTIAVDVALAGVGSIVTIGGTQYRITASATGSITIDGTVSVVDDDTFPADLPLGVTLEFAMEAAGIPGIEKIFREVQLFFGQKLFSTLTVNFTNENSDTPTPVTVSPSDYGLDATIPYVTVLRLDVPEALQRSALLKVSISLSETFSFFQLLGYTATSEASSERTGR